jgi:hypothetical protein
MKLHLFMDALGETFNREDGLPICALGGIDARDHRLTIYENCAGATLGLFTADLCPCQAKSLAEEAGKSLARDRFEIVLDTINRKRNLIIHRFPQIT